MSIRARIANLFSEVKASATAPLIAMQKLGQAVWTERSYAAMAKEGYQRNVIAYRCINEVAVGASQARWVLSRVDSNGNRMEINDHPLVKLLQRPNPFQGGAAFVEAATGFYCIAGNSYIESVDGSRGQPVELHILRPDRTRVIAGSAGPAGYDYTVNGQSKTWTAEEDAILHLKTFNPLDDWYGMSPLEAAAFSVDVHNATLEWNKALLDNRAQPSGAMVYNPKAGPDTLDEEQYQRLKQQIEEQYSGAKNAGRPILLEGGLTWQQLGLSPQDMDYINSKHTSSRDIALAYGVPPMLLGIPGDNTYANMQEARLALWEQTVLPWLYKLRDELNNWLVPKYGDPTLRLDIDEDAIPALVLRRERVWDKVQTADFLTFNEKREAVGYEAIDGGYQLLVPATLLPLGSEPPEAPTGAASKEALELLRELKDAGYSEAFLQQVTGSDYGDPKA